MPDRKAVCAERREKMLSEKVDYAKFLALKGTINS